MRHYPDMLLPLALAFALQPVPDSPPPSTQAAAVLAGERRAPVEPWHKRGVGLLAGGVLLTGGWLTAKTMVTLVDPWQARRAEADCDEGCRNGPLLHTLGAPVLVGAMGLLGGGMRRYSRYRVRNGLGRRWHPDATPRSTMLLGGALLGGGGVLLVGGLTAAYTADLSRVGLTSVVEVSWWGAASLGITGAMILGVGHGRALGERDRTTVFRPVVSPTFRGVALSGRF